MNRRINAFMMAMALGLSALAPSSAMAQEAAPAAPAPAVVAPAQAAATPEAANATAAAPAPAFDYSKPVAGIGMPTPEEMTFQKQFTPTGHYALWMHDGILLWMCGIISVFVLGLLIYTMWRFRRSANPIPSRTSHNTAIEVAWTLIPVLILIGIAIPSIDLLAQQFAPAPKNSVVVKVTGYQWYWGYEYPDNGIPEYVSNMLPPEKAIANGEPRLLGADKRLVLPVGVPIKLIITGADVIHSFSIPAFWVKEDAVPGRLNERTFTIDKAGVYYGVCSELCGARHGFMPIAVEAVSPAKFQQWVKSQGGTMLGEKAAPVAAAAAVPAAPAPAAAENSAAPAAPATKS